MPIIPECLKHNPSVPMIETEEKGVFRCPDCGSIHDRRPQNPFRESATLQARLK